MRLGLRLQLTLFLLGMVTSMLLWAADDATGHVFGNPETWRWAPSRTYHVENYGLTLHFDQDKGEVFGDEVVTLRPFE